MSTHKEKDEPILKVRDKGRLEVGQDVTWVIQTDGLSLSAFDASQMEQREPSNIAVIVSDIKHLGESSIVTLSAQAPQGVMLRMTVTGPQRALIEQDHRMMLSLDTAWVHIMPLGLTS